MGNRLMLTCDEVRRIVTSVAWAHALEAVKSVYLAEWTLPAALERVLLSVWADPEGGLPTAAAALRVRQGRSRCLT